jgi:LDH2 family malate/lactate/ureidoglycolate dehydrogenase
MIGTSDTRRGFTNEQRFAADSIVDHGSRILRAHGVPEPHARLVAESLVTADMWGHPSHGMLRLPWYVARLQSGAMRSVTKTETLSSFAAVSVIDVRYPAGRHSPRGHFAAELRQPPRRRVVAKSAAATTAPPPTGPASWLRWVASASSPPMAARDGTGRHREEVGANPWSIAIPDWTTAFDCQHAAGQGLAARQRGEQLPDGAIDASGLPTTDHRPP